MAAAEEQVQSKVAKAESVKATIESVKATTESVKATIEQKLKPKPPATTKPAVVTGKTRTKTPTTALVDKEGRALVAEQQERPASVR